MNYNDLKVGGILSENSFFKILEVKPNELVLATEGSKEPVSIGKSYIMNILKSADSFLKEEKKNMTELAELFMSSSRIAMTVCYTKKDQEKSQKQFKAEVAEWTENVKQAFLSKGLSGLEDFATKPVSKTIPGETRVMKGRHYGQMDNLGRISFIDMELTKDDTKDYDTRIRQVDPRTIIYLIVDGVKYSLK